MNLDDIDISKLPAEVRRELLQLDVSIDYVLCAGAQLIVV